MNAQTGIINIRGKDYQTVALRVQMFREKHPDYALTTEVVDRTDDCVVMKATISDAEGRVKATGHAEEYRASSQINRTSALENAETSAIGRALAACGFGGTEFATANEVQNAIHQQTAGGQSEGRAASPRKPAPAVTDEQLAKLQALIPAAKLTPALFCQTFGVTSVNRLPAERFAEAEERLNARLAAMAKSKTNKEATNA